MPEATAHHTTSLSRRSVLLTMPPAGAALVVGIAGRDMPSPVAATEFFRRRYHEWCAAYERLLEADELAATAGYSKTAAGRRWKRVVEENDRIRLQLEDEMIVTNPETMGDFVIKIVVLLVEGDFPEFNSRLMADARSLLPRALGSAA